MAEVMDNVMHKEYASNAKANAGLTLGIIGTSLAGLTILGNMSNGGGGGLLGNLFGGGNGNCGGCGNPKVTLDAEELYLERQASANYLETTKQYYQGVIDFNKSFDLYKLSRDQKDELNAKIDAVDKKVDVMAAIRPYQDALINAKIDQNALVSDFNLYRRTCRMISGELVLPSTPTVTGYPSYSPFSCPATNTTTGA